MHTTTDVMHASELSPLLLELLLKSHDLLHATSLRAASVEGFSSQVRGKAVDLILWKPEEHISSQLGVSYGHNDRSQVHGLRLANRSRLRLPSVRSSELFILNELSAHLRR